MTETLFLIHGMWGGPWYWSHYRELFEAQGYRVITPTLRYHDMDPQGVPDPRLGTTSLLDYAADLEAEIRQLDEPPIIIGHSMGGLLAQILASRGLARALVLLMPAAPAGIMAITPSVIRCFWREQMRWGFWRRPMRLRFSDAVYAMLHRLPPDVQRQTYDRFVYESGRAAFEIGFWLFDRQSASRVDATSVNCAVLVVAAAEDRITPASVVRKVADKYQSLASYKEFAGHAHWAVAEPGWQQLAGYVSDWLEQIPNSSRS